jgi:hypothetical protein
VKDLRPYITDFSKGELSGRFEGRYDLADYYKSSRTLENMILLSMGGAQHIPGTVFLVEAFDQSNPCRLIPFEYSTTESFMIEMGISGTDAYYKIWKISDHTVSKVLTQFGADTWTAADLRKIKYKRAGNVMYFTHPGHAPHKLTFTSPGTWAVTTPAFTAPGWASVADYPSCLTFFEQRLVFARGQTIWGSKSGLYEDFTVGTGAGDSYEYTIASDDILWMVAQKAIMIGTVGGEWIMTANGPITPNDVYANQQSPYGSVDIQGTAANDAIVYAQKGGRRLRDFAYSNERGGYISPDLTFFADHILESSIVDLYFQRTPDPIIWGVRDDGELVGLTYQKLQGIAGWHRHPIDGKAEAVACAITSGEEDEVWIQTSRTINSVTKRYLEYFKPHKHFTVDTQEDCYFVRCGMTFDGGAGEAIEGATQAKPVVITITGHSFANDDLVKITDVVGMTELNNVVYMVKNIGANDFELYLTDGTTQLDGTGFTAYVSGGTVTKVYETLTGLSHLEAKTLDVLADGAAHPQRTVASGEITLNRYANKIHVGIPCHGKIKPQRFGQGPDYMKHIDKLTIRFYQSLGCKVGPDEDNLEIVQFREGTDPMDSPPPLFTGDKEDVPFKGGYEKGGDILIVQDQPLPMTVLSIMPSVGVYG